MEAVRTVTFSIAGAREVLAGTVGDDGLSGSVLGDATTGDDGDHVLFGMSGFGRVFGGDFLLRGNAPREIRRTC